MFKLVDYMYEVYQSFYDGVITESEYSEIVEDAILVLGDKVHCNDVDPISFQTYSDCYKDEYNFRPRGFITLKDVKAYFDYRDDPKTQAALQEQWDEEDRWVNEMEAKYISDSQADTALWIEACAETAERNGWEIEQRI
jgi:hypothetical protein